MPSPQKKNNERKKMSSQEGFITVKVQNCETEFAIISGQDLIDKAFIIN